MGATHAACRKGLELELACASWAHSSTVPSLASTVCRRWSARSKTGANGQLDLSLAGARRGQQGVAVVRKVLRPALWLDAVRGVLWALGGWPLVRGGQG
eukprot:13095660-Alexandrium_andersonii.AAC.1